MPATAVTKPAKAGRQKTARKLQGARSTRAPSPAGKPPKAPTRQPPSTRAPVRTRPTQAERREKAEHAILAAALEIIADRGIDELTLAEAGEKAGYSRAPCRNVQPNTPIETILALYEPAYEDGWY